MIAIDTSALMAMLTKEAAAEDCFACLQSETHIIMSAGTYVEALIVAAHRNIRNQMRDLIDTMDVEIIAITPAAARRIAEVHTRWGKGVHPAGLNFGDCFSYDAAREHNCRLLFIGNDFSRTDIASAL